MILHITYSCKLFRHIDCLINTERNCKMSNIGKEENTCVKLDAIKINVLTLSFSRRGD